MQSVDIFAQPLPTVIGFPSMPLSSMAMVATFFGGYFATQCVNDRFYKLKDCTNKSSVGITALQRSDPKLLP
jgi:hypothetical protein